LKFLRKKCCSCFYSNLMRSVGSYYLN
jgi:hypothetical protein